MWMRLVPLGGQDGWSWAISISLILLLFPCFVEDVAANLTDAATSGVAGKAASNPAPAPGAASSSGENECHNTTTVSGAGTGGSLSVVNHVAYPHPSIISSTFLNGAFTCQPYHGVYVNHIYFQLANAFFLLSHLAPSGIHGVLYLRCTLLVGCAFLALWGWAIACWLDAALWNTVFVAINFVHVCMLLYRIRPVRFSREVEEVYVAVFRPLRVSRHQFKKVLNCMKTIRQLKYQEVYAQEKVTKVDSLSLVLSGKLVVSQNGRALHIVFPHQFLDSPEWFGVSTDEYFQVSITAMEESRILLWHRDKLKLSIITDQFLQAVFDHILGRDVVKKLMQVSETMAVSSHQQQNGQVVGIGGIGSCVDNDSDTKLLVVKKAGDNQGITALINRQLQGNRYSMISVRLVCAESYQAAPIPGLDPTYSEFRGSEVKHVPVIRIFGSTACGQKTCLHIHGVFPYMYIPYAGGENSHSLAYRLAASLDAAINVSLGAASCHNQHVFKVQLVSGIPLYGYHEKEHQFFKVYFYNPAMIKRAANLLQNGAVLSGNFQPYEAHIPYIQQFMIDFNLHGMNMVDLRCVKHRVPTKTALEIDLSSVNSVPVLDNVEYLPDTIRRQSTCKLEIDALASDVLNRHEIESEIVLNPGLATIWEEEKARRLQLNLSGGDSQLVNPKSPTRSSVVTENDLYQQQRLANRLSTISQEDVTNSLNESKNPSSYPLETGDDCDVTIQASRLEHHVKPCSTENLTKVPQHLRDLINSNATSSLLLSTTPNSHSSLDCSILDADDIPVIDILNELANDNGSESAVDDNSLLGSQQPEAVSQAESDTDLEENEDLNLTSLQLNSLSLTQHSRLSQKSKESKASNDQKSASNLLRDLSVFDMDTDNSSDGSICDNIPQYDGAGDTMPTVLKSDKKASNSGGLNHLSAKRSSFEIISPPACNVNQCTKISRIQTPSCSSNVHTDIDFDLDLPVSLQPSHYLDNSNDIFNERFTQLYEDETNFDSDLENLQSTMEIGMLSPNPEEAVELNNQSIDDKVIPIDKVLTGDPCFTESAVFDKSDITELQDQYVSLLGNALLPPIVHNGPYINSLNAARPTEIAEISNDDDKRRKSSFPTKLVQNSIENRCVFPLENITPNIQNLNNQMQVTPKVNAAENCKDIDERLTPPDSDYNCNVVATWEELQNFRFPERQTSRRKCPKKNDSETLVNRQSDIVRPSSKRIRTKKEMSALLSQPNQIDTQALHTKYNYNSSVKPAIEEKNYTELEAIRNNANRRVYTHKKTIESIPVKVGKNQSYSSYKFYKSKNFAENRLRQPKINNSKFGLRDNFCLSNKQSSRQHKVTTLPDIVDINVYAAGDERRRLPGVTYPSHPVYGNQSVVESILADFILGQEDELPLTAIDSSSKNCATDTSNLISYYSSETSHNRLASGGMDHNHATYDQRGKLSPQSVYRPNHLWVIEKRKRGRKKESAIQCNNPACELPIVLIKKLEMDNIPHQEMDVKLATKLEKNNRIMPVLPKSSTDIPAVREPREYAHKFKTSPTKKYQKCSSSRNQLFYEFDEESSNNPFKSIEDIELENRALSPETKVKKVFNGSTVKKDLSARLVSCRLKKSNCSTSESQYISNKSSPGDYASNTPTINQNADTRRKNESMKMLSSPILRKIAPIRNINGLQNGKTKLVVLTIKNTFLNQEKVRRLSLDDPSVKHDHLLTPTKCEFSKITNFDADHHVANATYKCNTFDKNCVHPAAITSRNSGRTPQNNLLLTPELLLPNNQLIFARGEALPNHNSNICVIRLPISQSSKLNTQSEFVATQSSQSNNHCSTSISSESTATDTHCFAEVDRGSEKKSDAELANTLSKWKIMLDKRTDDKVNNSFSTSFTSQSFLSEKTVDDKYTPSTLRDEITVETQLKTNSAYDEPNSLHSNCIAPVHITRSIHRSSGTPYVSITSEHESIGKIVNSESIDTYANVNDMVFNANEESNRALNTFEEPFAYSPPLSEGIPSTNIDSFNSSILDGCSPVIQTFESTGETESQIPTNSRIEDLTPENPPNLEFTKHNLLNNDCKTCFSPSREYAVDAITSEIPKCLFEEDSSSEEEKEYTERDDIVEDMDQKEQFRNTEFVNSLDCLPDHKNLDVFDIDNISSDTFAGNESLDVSSLTNIGDELPKEVLESSPVNDRSDQFATEYFDLKDMDIVYHSSNTVANDKNTIVPSDAYERAIKSANAIGDTKVDENAENFNVLTVNAATLNMIGINSTNDHDDRSSNLSSIERNNESNEDHRVPTLITQIINSLEEDDEVQNSNFCTDRTIESIGNIASQFDNPLSEVTLNLEIDTNSNITKKCADLRNTRHKNGTQISKINNTRNTAVHEDNQNTVFPKDSSNIESASDTILRTGANESSDCPSTEAADNTKSTTLHSSEQKSAIGGSEEITSQKNDLRVTTETMANVSDATMFQGSQNDSSVAENEDIALQETVLRIINETNTNMCDVSQISSDQCNVRDTNDIQPKTFPGVQSVESVPENMEITSREKPLDTTNVMNATDDAATTLADIRKDAAVEDNDEIVSRDVFNVTNETNINTVVADTKSTYDENTENIGIHSATISQETQNNSSVEEKTVTVSGNVSRTETNANSEGVEKITSVDKKITNSLTMENSVEERNDNSVTRRHKRAYKLVSIQLEKIDLSKLNCHLTSIIKTQELHTPISEDKESQIQTGPIKSGTNGVCKNWTNKSANGKRVRFDDNIVWILENGRVVNSDQKSLTVPVSLLDDNPLLRQIKTRHSAGSSGKCSEKKKMLLLPKHKSQISVNSSDDSAAGTTIDDAAPRMDAISSVLENWSSAYKKIVSEKINSPPLSVDNCLTQYTKKVQLIRPDPKLLMVKLTCNETRWTNLRRKQKYMLQLGLYRTDLKNLICYSKPPTTAFIQLKLPRVVLKRLKPEVIKKYEPKQNITDTENPRKSLRQRRKTTCLPNIPAYDGAADCSSDDSDLDPDETVERQEKRICDYKPSAKKNPTKLIDLTPKKRHRTSDDSALQSASKHRKTDHLSPKIPDRSEKKSDLLSSPGCPSRSYSPLNIVITSPRIRNNPEQTNSPRSMKSLRKNADTIQTTPRRRHRQLREKLYENLSARPLQSKETDETVKDGPNGSELLGELLAIPSTSGLNTSRRCTDDFISATGSGQISCDDTGATIKSRNDVKKRLEFSFRKDNRTGKSRTLYMFDDDDTTSTSYKHGYDSVDMEHVERESGVGLENVDRNISKCLQDSSGRSVGITDNKSSDKPTVDKTVNDSCFKEDDDDTTDGDDNKPNKISASGYDRQKLTDNSDDEDENINLCNVTFTQYVETQRIENAQYHITAKRRGEGEREIVVKPRFNPPNSRQIAESMETFNIPVCRNEKPFFSNHHDVMNQKEVAHQMLNVPSKSMLNLPTFKSDLDSVTGIRRWRIMRVKEVYPTGINIKPSEMRQRLTGQNKIVIRPLRSPPALKSVKTWLRAKQYLKKNNEPKNLVAKNADSDPTCSGESASSEESISVVIQDSLQRDIFLHPKTGTQLTSRYVIAESGIPKMKNSEDSQQSNKSNVSIDASLRKALEDSNLFKNQDTSKHFPFTFGQIESSSQADQFKIPCKNLQELKPITTHQFLTILCLEVHVVTRGDLLPNPQYDAISAIFYAIQNDVPATSTLKALDYGIVVRDPEFDTTRARGYLKGAGVTCTIHYAANEEALFEKLVAIIQDCDPDILIGWELECLSWGYVFQRAAALGINLAPRASRIPTVQQAWENQTTELNILTEIKMPGRIVLDIWRLMRHELALQSYTFENVTYHVMRERLSCPSFATLTRWWGHRTPRIRWMVVDHYSKKVVGILKLLEHLDVIGKTSELARIYGIQFFEVFSRGSQFQVESVMLRLAKPANYVPVSPSVQQRASMRAPESLPLIMEPESVFYSDPLIVLDFQSLYPSIIIAHNYCYSTCLGRIENIGQPDPFEFGAATLKVTKQTALKLKGKLNFSPCGVAYVKPEVRKGILPRMLTEMIETRLMVKKAMKDHSKADQALQRALFSRQLGLKLLANVTFGYTHANFSGRMPCIEIGDSIVSKARETLERAITLIESNRKWNVRVVYGDTDSLFILLPGKSRKEAFEVGTEIANAVTADNPTPMKLKLEKIMQPSILQTKKRYCGYMYESPDQETPTYLAKGIETVRRDGCPAVSKVIDLKQYGGSEMLEKTLRILFDTKDVSLIKNYVTRQLDKVLRGRVSIQDLTFAREFRGLQGYKSSACVPALELTQRLMIKDPRAVPRTSERVPYVIVAGAPNQPLFQCVRSPWEVLTDPGLRPNSLYYITRVIIPPLNRCLNLIGVDANIWFAEMPHRQIAQYSHTSRNDVQKSTISQYFGTVACAVCSNTSKAGICIDCLTLPNETLVILHEKIRQMDRAYSNIHLVCRSCIGRADNIDCTSLNCPVLYRRLQAENDRHHMYYIREIIEKGNSLEF